MTWLIFGSNGQLGSHICDLLEKKRIEYVALNKSQGSIGDANFVNMQVSLIKPSAIVNCAAWTDVDGAEKDEYKAKIINAIGVGYLSHAAKIVGATFAHVSTDYVFSGVRNTPWNIDDEKSPSSVYGRTKALGEDLIKNIYPENSYIFRTAWLYSEHRHNFAKAMVRAALENDNHIKVVNDQKGQPTSASDLAAQIVTCIEIKIKPGIYHASNSGEATWNEFGREIFRLLGEDSNRVLPMSSSELSRPAPRPSYSVLSQDCWKNSGVEVMREWKIALKEQINNIKNAVVNETI